MSLRTLVLLLAGTAVLHAADLTTRDGTVYRNYTVLSHDTGYITILYADGGGKIPLSNLPADLQKLYGYDPVKSDSFVQQDKAAERQARSQLSQEELAAAQQQQLAAQKQRLAMAAAVTSAQTITGFAAKFTNKLIVLDNGSSKDASPQTLAGIKYLAFYFSASWCPPCRAFTPSLVSFYRDFKPSHPDFELIFVNDDRSEDDMMAYMKNDDMTWPALRFNEVRDPDALRYEGTGIPDLVLVDADGNVLSDSFQDGNYIGPQHVVDDIRKMVK